MRVLFLIRELEAGGGQRQLANLANGLAEAGHEVTVATFYSGHFYADLLKRDVRLILIGKKYRWDVLPFLARLTDVIRHERPDVLHSYMSANVIASLLKPMFSGLPIVWGVRSSRIDLKRYDRLSRAVGVLSRWYSRTADLIIVNSRAGYADCLADGFPQSRTVVVPNGIDTSYFRPDRQSGRKIRAELALSDSEYVIGCVARLDPMKGHDVFLKAASELLLRHPFVRFVCVGDGPDAYRTKLLNMAIDHGLEGRITFISARTDICAVYNSFDLLTLPSISEGFPNVLGEALACSVRCVATDVGDARWIVDDPALTVPPNDPQALVHAWEGCIAGRDSWDGRAAQVRIQRDFSTQALVRGTETLLRRIVDTNSYYRRHLAGNCPSSHMSDG